ncbi:protoporphyrinogen/coproporphyrinogen oxidase [Streptomyces sp. 4N509B]|uniref:protoporphyrinogen/coproporphyrinogen oxidase n=1 Tax=Streptomyces sp. 4N509B TaxID=3457413 RepID=UPI003FD427A1
MAPDLDVAVVGAGVAGLTAAHELRRAGLDVRVFEERPHVGGRTHSHRHRGYTIDEGAEQLSPHGYRATWQLLTRLGVPASEIRRIGRPVAVWRDGRAHPGVADRSAPLTGAGLSPRARLDLARFLTWAGRRRAGFDCDRPEDTPLGHATVAELAGRYHGDLHDYLLQPVAGCFFGWDTARSAAAPMVSLLLEVGPAAGWLTYAGGMDLLARRLAEGLDVVTGRPVQEVVTDDDGDGGARLLLGAGREPDGSGGGERGGTETVTARAVVLCVPAPVAARLHVNAPDAERDHLAACTYRPVLKLSCLLDRPLAPAHRAGGRTPYIVLTPAVEESELSGIIVDHAKHPDRAPAGKGLLTLMAAPGVVPELLGAPREQVVDRLVCAAGRFVPGLEAAATEHLVHAFTHGLPEATPEALRGRARFMARPVRPVEYAGDWLMLRPSSEGAVRSGALAASRVLSRLRPLRGAGAPPAVTGRPTTAGEKHE